MSERDTRTHEVTFCSRVKSWADALFAQHPEWPFRRAEIEESKAIKRKRSDLRIHGDAGKLILAGEVKMPGTLEGRSPYNPDLVEDRRALDLAVFELLVVADAKEREALCDELYRETAAYFRQIRMVEIQKQEQRTRAEGREFRTDELAADLWDPLTDDEKQPLGQWLAAQTTGGKSFAIPEGHASLPDANDFLDPNTVFFRQSTGGKAKPQRLPLPSRSHAETIFMLAQPGLHGSVRLPETENAARDLQQQLDARLAGIAEKADHLARSRTSDERKAADLAGLL
jgi:hypothetical protein